MLITCTLIHSFSLLCNSLPLIAPQYMNCPRAGGHGDGSSCLFTNSAAVKLHPHFLGMPVKDTHERDVEFEIPLHSA